jgi:hypothetical protein
VVEHSQEPIADKPSQRWFLVVSSKAKDSTRAQHDAERDKQGEPTTNARPEISVRDAIRS